MAAGWSAGVARVVVAIAGVASTGCAAGSGVCTTVGVAVWTYWGWTKGEWGIGVET